jgi:alpha,alpha-trehalose phosphorylase
MIHHERLRPPPHGYPADEWNVIVKGFHLEFLAQLEMMLALGNGYLGMRGCPEEGGPNAENSTLNALSSMNSTAPAHVCSRKDQPKSRH